MNALVTGGAGFIGSNLVDRLVADGAHVRVLDDLSTGYAANVNPVADLREASVTSTEDVATAMAGVDTVFHLAAHRAVLASVDRPLETNAANVDGTLIVLKSALDAGVRRVVYASSSSVYGNTSVFPTPEDADKAPRSPYAVSKLAAEHYCRVFAELYDVETVALRYFNVFGPRQRPDTAYAAVIPLFISALSSGESPIVHGDGKQSRDFTYVSDVVDANILAATCPAEMCSGRAFNVAGGRSHTLLELIGVLEEIMSVTSSPHHVEARQGDIRRSQADVTLASKVLGFVTHVGFADGLSRTVAASQGSSRPAGTTTHEFGAR